MRDSAATTGNAAGVGDGTVEERDRSDETAGTGGTAGPQGAVADRTDQPDHAGPADRATDSTAHDGAGGDRHVSHNSPTGTAAARDAALDRGAGPAGGSAGGPTGVTSTPDEGISPPERPTRTPDRETPAAQETMSSPDTTPRTSGHAGTRPWFDRPTYVRPPGMPPPPDYPEEGTQAADLAPPVGVASPAARSATTTPPRLRPGLLGAPFPAGGAPFPAGGMPTTTSPPAVSPDGTGTGTGVDTGTRPGRQPLAVGTARVREAVRGTRTGVSVPRGPRRARLGLRRVDPWSVMKFSFIVSLVLFVVMIVAASVLYLALDTMGVFSSINSTLGDLIQSGEGEEGFQITARGVLSAAAVVGAINVALFTALATLGAFIYNVCADLVGGIEVTLAERD